MLAGSVLVVMQAETRECCLCDLSGCMCEWFCGLNV